MPLTNSYNALGVLNQQPEYQMLWEPTGVNPSSSGAIVLPTAAGAGAWVAGACLAYTTAGVGANPGPGGDAGATAYTVQTVDLSPTTTTTYLAGVLLGIGTLGAAAPVVPNTLPVSATGPQLVAMVGKLGICLVLVDNTTTIGHTLICSTTSGHTGQFSDSGGNTRTYGTTVGIALQAVTVSTGPKLCWAHVNFP